LGTSITILDLATGAGTVEQICIWSLVTLTSTQYGVWEFDVGTTWICRGNTSGTVIPSLAPGQHTLTSGGGDFPAFITEPGYAAGMYFLAGSPEADNSGGDMLWSSPDVVSTDESNVFTAISSHILSLQFTGPDATAPEINITGNGEAIASGSSPIQSNSTDWGEGPGEIHRFVIENTGTGDLTLPDSPIVDITGDTAEFTLNLDASTPVVPSGSTFFDIKFVPSANELFEATLSIANNDDDENPYIVNIQGTGLIADPGSGVVSAKPETIREMSQDGADITDPASMPAGGWGIRGWLSALYTAFQDTRESNGALAVNIQDQHSRAFDLFFSQNVGSPTTLTADTIIDSYSISVTTGHAFAAGDDFVLRDSVTQRGFTGQVVSVAGDNTVNMDRPITSVLPSATTVVQETTTELNVDGSSTRQTFSIGSPLTAELDITRFLIQMTTTATPDFDEFGDQTALTRGCVMRIVNSSLANLWNVKSNAELANLMYDLTIYDAALPFAVNGLAGRMTYGGQNKHGVTLRIGGGETLEFVVQDDLSDLLSFKIIACGHIVTD
jgi:hypothetical protein